jgi:hypothetical protein
MSITRTDGASGAYFEIGLTGILNLSDGTNVLSISPSTGWTPPAGATVFADVSAMASGAADIVIRDNVADAFTVRQGSTAYITFRTTNDAEAIILGKPTLFTAMDITMSASPHSLVYGTAGANQTKIVGNVRRLTLAPQAVCCVCPRPRTARATRSGSTTSDPTPSRSPARRVPPSWRPLPPARASCWPATAPVGVRS